VDSSANIESSTAFSLAMFLIHHDHSKASRLNDSVLHQLKWRKLKPLESRIEKLAPAYGLPSCGRETVINILVAQLRMSCFEGPRCRSARGRERRLALSGCGWVEA